MKKIDLQKDIFISLVQIISETNGITLDNTLELATKTSYVKENKKVYKSIVEFQHLLDKYKIKECSMPELLEHPVAKSLYDFFKLFPLRYQEKHTHLSGALTPEFIFDKIGQSDFLEEEKKIKEVFGKNGYPIKSVKALKEMVTVTADDYFARYLEKLYLAKIVLTTKEVHSEAAYSMAKDMYENYNIGSLHLKFTFSRVANLKAEELSRGISSEEAMLGLFEGLIQYKSSHSDFDFFLSPSFRKENNFFDKQKFDNKQDDFMDQVERLIKLLESNPELAKHVVAVDTVGNEINLYKKKHFKAFQLGFRKLQQLGLRISSHHGEVWHTLNKGIQAVDNAMNIWRIDTLEHGLSLGVNPNYYFQSLFERVLESNSHGKIIEQDSVEGRELADMNWNNYEYILKKIYTGISLSVNEIYQFTKIKYFTALETEQYQHDVLNRMIDKDITLTSLPTSNLRLTSHIPDFRDHPFSWWEKKNITQAIGTDNYITLDTDFIREMLILLFSDSRGLKITKLLIVATGENRRPYISNQLWQMRKKYVINLG